MLAGYRRAGVWGPYEADVNRVVPRGLAGSEALREPGREDGADVVGAAQIRASRSGRGPLQCQPLVICILTDSDTRSLPGNSVAVAEAMSSGALAALDQACDVCLSCTDIDLGIRGRAIGLLARVLYPDLPPDAAASDR